MIALRRNSLFKYALKIGICYTFIISYYKGSCASSEPCNESLNFYIGVAVNGSGY